MKRNVSSSGFKSPILETTPVPSPKNAALKESVRSTTRILNLFAKNRRDSPPISDGSIHQSNVTNSPVAKENSHPSTDSGKIAYNVVYGKKSMKKHKTWEGDGVLEVNGKNAVLKDTEGAVMGRTTVNPANLTEGLRLPIGSKEVEIIDAITQVSKSPVAVRTKKVEEKSPPQKRFKKSQPSQSFVAVRPGLKLKYEPLVMPEPSTEAQWAAKGTVKEVTLDSCLATVLRPHQRYGVVFLYQCVMGLTTPEHYGAILADEMGLGKTLQCIALVWTLLRQGPFGSPVVKRVLIVAPSSLCGTWSKEFVRWLGSQRLSTFVVDAKNKPKEFTKFPKTPVMIISYEMFVRCYPEVEQIDFDLLICDEGHRLKNSAIKMSKLLSQLNCKRRILLTGTPVQNNLQEFFALADFVNPGVLGNATEYKQNYEDPILASQQPDCTQYEAELGAAMAKQLNEHTKPFILRRTQEVIDKYLPKKHEMVIFCRLSPQQEELYSAVTDYWFNRTVLGDCGVSHLSIMTALKKICNHPSLLKKDKSDFLQSIGMTVVNKLTRVSEPGSSGKVAVVQALLDELKGSTDKLVLVSYFTQTLDLLGKICDAGGFKYCRLDGSTPTTSRNNIVEQFNSKSSECCVFLLSARAGGVGLNLSGASRLVLFDSDWNPASDLQAMARVWRDGQKKSVFIYRLLTSGSIEEKIYQRQISKTSLSEAVVDPSNPSLMKLSSEELKDLFTLNTYTSSLTHDLMQCPCLGQGEVRKEGNDLSTEDARDCQLTLQSKTIQQHLTMNQLLNWQHFAQPLPNELLQEINLSKVSEIVTYVFKNTV